METGTKTAKEIQLASSGGNTEAGYPEWFRSWKNGEGNPAEYPEWFRKWLGNPLAALPECFIRWQEERDKKFFSPETDLYVMPGGLPPKRMTGQAIGWDAYLRAIVSGEEMDHGNPVFRKTLFDFFENPHDGKIAEKVFLADSSNGEKPGLVYRLAPEESVLVGLGFVTAMAFPLFYWIAPRSGLASRHKITITNAPGTVDPDYRGEAGVLVHNESTKPFDLRLHMRIAQGVFAWAIIPNLRIVPNYSDLSKTERQAGGFGWTGLFG